MAWHALAAPQKGRSFPRALRSRDLGRRPVKRISSLEWAAVVLTILACCGCQAIWTPAAATAGGAVGAAVGGPGGAAAVAGAAAAASELLIGEEEKEDLAAAQAKRDEQFLALVGQVVAAATPEVRDRLAGDLTDAATARAEAAAAAAAKRAEENSKSALEKKADELTKWLVDLGWFAAKIAAAAAAIRYGVPLAWKWFTRKKRAVKEVEKTKSAVREVLRAAIPPDRGASLD